jgi:hypothetical protein
MEVAAQPSWHRAELPRRGEQRSTAPPGEILMKLCEQDCLPGVEVYRTSPSIIGSRLAAMHRWFLNVFSVRNEAGRQNYHG